MWYVTFRCQKVYFTKMLWKLRPSESEISYTTTRYFISPPMASRQKEIFHIVVEDLIAFLENAQTSNGNVRLRSNEGKNFRRRKKEFFFSSAKLSPINSPMRDSNEEYSLN